MPVTSVYCCFVVRHSVACLDVLLADLLHRAFAAGLAWMLLALTVPSVANASVNEGATAVASALADTLRFLVFRFLATCAWRLAPVSWRLAAGAAAF